MITGFVGTFRVKLRSNQPKRPLLKENAQHTPVLVVRSTNHLRMSKSETSSHHVVSGLNSSRSGTLPVLEQLKTGSQVIVGNHRVEIVKYLAEGGFAHIYVVRFIEYANELEQVPTIKLEVGDLACLKRVLVTDENGLNEMRNEVSVMKQLSGCPNIVQYLSLIHI